MRVKVTSDVFSGIEQFSADIQEHVIRSAAYAGAKVMYDEMHLKVPVKRGILRDSIYHWFDKKQSTPEKKIYAIGPNKAKAPHWYFIEYGHWRYNRPGPGFWMKSKSNKNARVGTPGTMDRSVHDLPGALDIPVWTPPHPFVRPTFEQNADRAIRAMRERATQRIKELASGGTASSDVAAGAPVGPGGEGG